MDIQLLMTGTLAVSLFTGLIVEVIKKIIAEETKCYNLLALLVSCVLSIAVGICYVLLQHLSFNAEVIITILAMTLCSAIASMLGFDKIKQTIEQIVGKK